MKILIINNHISDALGGSEMQCDLIARGLTDLGHQVIYGSLERGINHKYSNFPYKIIPIKIEKEGEFSKLLKKEKPDIIYWRLGKHYLLKTVKQNKNYKIPFVFATSHIKDITKYACRYRFKKAGLLNKLKRQGGVIKTKLKSRWNYCAFRYINAITFQLNNQKTNSISIQKQRVIWNSVFDNKDFFEWKKPYIAWVANIKAPKQPEKYIKLASIFSENYPHIDFLMVGAIQDKKYKPIIQKANENKNLHYLGFQKPEIVNGILAKSICLIHTCKPEGFPNNMIQSWAQGCPVITLEYDPDNLIKNKNIGFVSGNFKQMIKDTEKLITNKKLRDIMGVRAQEFAKKNFNPSRMVKEVEQFLIEVIKEYKK